jgi:hypothetical protein
MTERPPDLDRLLERHRAFWERRLTDGPLTSVRQFRPLRPNPDVPLLGGRRAIEGTPIVPDELDLDAMLAQWPVPDEPIAGDYLREAAPYGLCWVEGFAGANVEAASGSIWSAPVPFDWTSVGSLRERLRPDNRWYAKLREYVGRLATEADGLVPVTQTLMRGPIDIAEALVGTEELALALYDHPDELANMLGIGADAFITIGNLFAEAAPAFHGGHTIFGIWAPGMVVRMQADHASVLSPEDYRKWCLPDDRRMAAAFDYTFYHLHSGNMHVLDSLLDNEALNAIEVCLDPWPFAPRLRDLLPQITRIQAAGKSLLIDGGPISKDELDQALSTLPHSGLALRVSIGSTWD